MSGAFLMPIFPVLYLSAKISTGRGSKDIFTQRAEVEMIYTAAFEFISIIAFSYTPFICPGLIANLGHTPIKAVNLC